MIRTYIDHRLIDKFKKVIVRENKFSEDFNYLKSLYDFLIKNKQNELYLAEKNRKIDKNDLDSMIKRGGILPFKNLAVKDYTVNFVFDFNSLDKATVLFFIEFSNQEIDVLTKNISYFYANSVSIIKKWKQVSLQNTFAKSLTISFRDYQKTNFSYNNTFKNYSSNCNSVLFSERYLRNWSNSSLVKNLIPLICSVIPNETCKAIYLTIITSETNQSSPPSSLQDQHQFIQGELSKKYNIELSTICVYEDMFYGDEKTEVQNIIHDRHLMTNYLHLSSLHSFDIIGRNGVKKDSEINVKSILGSSHYCNSIKKRKSYLELLKKITGNPLRFDLIGNYMLNPIFKNL